MSGGLKTALKLFFGFYFTVLLFKIFNVFTDQVNDLAVRRTSVILGNIMKLVMELAVYPKPKMLAFVVFYFVHKLSAQIIVYLN